MANNFPNNYTRRPKPVATKQDSDNIVTEQTGYLSTKQLVENMVLAGKRLYDYRHGVLDVEGVGDEDYDEDQDAAVPYERDLVDESMDIDRKFEKRESSKKHEALSGEKLNERSSNVSDGGTDSLRGGSGEPEVRSEGETSPS